MLLDQGPGGMPRVYTSAFDSFAVLSAGGTAVTYAINGVAVGTPLFDGRGRVAFWKRPALRSGAHTLNVWEVASGRERTLLTLTDEPPGFFVWTADAQGLVVWTRALESGAPARLLHIDPSSGQIRVIMEISLALGAVYADDAVIVGVAADRYVVIDARSGRVRLEAPRRAPLASEFKASDDGAVLELVHNFESEAGPMRVWSAPDPPRTLATVAERGTAWPHFWPGRGEVVYTGRAGISAVSYRTGATRLLAGLAEPPSLLGFDATGDYLVTRDSAGYLILERHGDDLRPRTDLRFPVPISEQMVLGIVR
jgi:hypothetical protein